MVYRCITSILLPWLVHITVHVESLLSDISKVPLAILVAYTVNPSTLDGYSSHFSSVEGVTGIGVLSIRRSQSLM